jgi:transcriptional regulator
LRAVPDAQWLRALLQRLTAQHEASQASPWSMADAPADYIDAVLRAVVGIEITVTRLDAKWKVSQNRSEADRHGVMAALTAQGGAQGGDEAAAMAAMVTQGTPPRS